MLETIKRTIRKILPEKSTVDQLKEMIELAEAFDALQMTSGWEKIVKHMGNEVQSELLEATKYKYEPVRQTTHTVRWDAKRELLDSALGYIQSTQDERDRIIREYKERNIYGNAGESDD